MRLDNLPNWLTVGIFTLLVVLVLLVVYAVLSGRQVDLWPPRIYPENEVSGQRPDAANKANGKNGQQQASSCESERDDYRHFVNYLSGLDQTAIEVVTILSLRRTATMNGYHLEQEIRDKGFGAGLSGKIVGMKSGRIVEGSLEETVKLTNLGHRLMGVIGAFRAAEEIRRGGPRKSD